jgi:hypothetical protein
MPVTPDPASFAKAKLRRDIIQILAESIIDGVFSRFMFDTSGGVIDLANEKQLARSFDNLVRDVSCRKAIEWKHFREIKALSEVIKAYREME